MLKAHKTKREKKNNNKTLIICMLNYVNWKNRLQY